MDSSPRNRGAVRAFTLIELLVVIAIIAILAAILFPVFARARERAKMTACTSNLKQLYIATQTYRSDFDELAPARWMASRGSSPEWMQYAAPACFSTATASATPTPPFADRQAPLLDPYLKSIEVRRCPSDAGMDGYKPFWKTTGAWKENTNGGSYPFNPNVCGRNPDTFDVNGLSRNLNGGDLEPGTQLDLGNRCMFWDAGYYHKFKSVTSRQVVMWNGSVRLATNENQTRQYLW